jgi:hypothetical protein
MASQPTPAAAAPHVLPSIDALEAALVNAVRMASRSAETINSDVHPSTLSVATANAHRVATVDAFMKSLTDLKAVTAAIDDSAYVPMQVLSMVDDGRNPAIFTRSCIAEVRTRADRVRGRIAASGLLKDSIVQARDAAEVEAAVPAPAP